HRAERVVALWSGAAERLVELHGLEPDRVDVIPNAADAERFTPAPASAAAELRHELGIDDGPVVLTVGALSPEKRLDAAIDGVAGVDGARLVVVGDGPLRRELEQRAAAAGAEVRFVGARPDLVPWYRAADVLLLTSRTEGMPGVVIEAGLCGLPVVATDVGGVAEVVEHDRTGAMVGSDPTQGELSEAIRTALSRHDGWGAAATIRCRERFSLTTVAAEWATTLRSAC
ncbi:MAG: glycosyltransferase, partial [Actinomycetota bacterium]